MVYRGNYESLKNEIFGIIFRSGKETCIFFLSLLERKVRKKDWIDISQASLSLSQFLRRTRKERKNFERISPAKIEKYTEIPRKKREKKRDKNSKSIIHPDGDV